MSVLEQRLPSCAAYDVREIMHALFRKAAGVESGYYLGASDIAGQGVFASQDYEPGEAIGVAMTPGDTDEFGCKIWNLTELARYCNHQRRANAKVVKQDGRFQLVAAAPIPEDDEIVSDYAQVTRAIGPRSRMMWDGKDVPVTDLQDYVEREDDAQTGTRPKSGQDA